MPSTGEKKRLANVNRLVVFIFLYIFWMIFSGVFDAFHLSLGAICSGLVAYFFHDLLIEDIGDKLRFKKIVRFLVYLPWLIYQVILANLHVAYLVINPRGIDPQIVKYKSTLKSDFSKVTFANSITLTPGTITMDIVNDEFYVHALSQKVADDLRSGEMEEQVAHIFFENDHDKNSKNKSQNK